MYQFFAGNEEDVSLKLSNRVEGVMVIPAGCFVFVRGQFSVTQNQRDCLMQWKKLEVHEHLLDTSSFLRIIFDSE